VKALADLPGQRGEHALAAVVRCGQGFARQAPESNRRGVVGAEILGGNRGTRYSLKVVVEVGARQVEGAVPVFDPEQPAPVRLLEAGEASREDMVGDGGLDPHSGFPAERQTDLVAVEIDVGRCQRGRAAGADFSQRGFAARSQVREIDEPDGHRAQGVGIAEGLGNVLKDLGPDPRQRLCKPL
jgi:hypothetical protein